MGEENSFQTQLQLHQRLESHSTVGELQVRLAEVKKTGGWRVNQLPYNEVLLHGLNISAVKIIQLNGAIT